MRAETKATSIPPEVKKAVYIRDNGFCVLCGSPYGDPVAHVVRRSQGGKGIERNIVTRPVTEPMTRARTSRG